MVAVKPKKGPKCADYVGVPARARLGPHFVWYSLTLESQT